MTKMNVKKVAALLAAGIVVVPQAEALDAITYDTITVAKGINIYVDNVRVSTYDVNGNETEALIYDGTTYLPVRGISEVLGYEVSWNAEERIVEMTSPTNSNIKPTATTTAVKEKYNETINTASIEGIEIDGASVTFTDVNGKVVEPFVENGTTYIPVRGASEALGEEIGYESNVNITNIYIGDQPEEEVTLRYPSESLEVNKQVDIFYDVIMVDPYFSDENIQERYSKYADLTKYLNNTNTKILYYNDPAVEDEQMYDITLEYMEKINDYRDEVITYTILARGLTPSAKGYIDSLLQSKDNPFPSNNLYRMLENVEFAVVNKDEIAALNTDAEHQKHMDYADSVYEEFVDAIEKYLKENNKTMVLQ